MMLTSCRFIHMSSSLRLCPTRIKHDPSGVRVRGHPLSRTCNTPTPACTYMRAYSCKSSQHICGILLAQQHDLIPGNHLQHRHHGNHLQHRHHGNHLQHRHHGNHLQHRRHGNHQCNSDPTHHSSGCERLFRGKIGDQSKYHISPPFLQVSPGTGTVREGEGVRVEARRFIHRQGEAGNKQARREFALTPQGIVEASPPNLQPYMKLMRIDRPIGNWLLFLPCAWSISLSAVPGAMPDPYMLSLFALGSFFMRGAGCTINDMLDKDLDRKVERTKHRPLACGQISSFQALAFLGLQLSVSLAILLSFNWSTVLLGAASLIPCIIYPMMKRVTYWPQAFLGITLNWGVLISWSAIHGGLELPGCVLYISCVFWSMIYDTIYSHQDKADDILAGVKSTALKFGDDSKKWLTLFSSVMVGGLGISGILCEQTWPYFTGVAMVSGHLGYQIYSVDLNNGEDCSAKFRSAKQLGLMFWLMIVGANLLKSETQEEEAGEKDELTV